MTVYNLGSINADHFYRVSHLPAPGETLTAAEFSTGLGGKGANQSVAAAKAGSDVIHIGAVGKDGLWAVERLKGFGVNTDAIQIIETPTGHAIINIDQHGENAIVIFSGANRCQSIENVQKTLKNACNGDFLLIQNETDKQADAAKTAKQNGVSVVYSAAPFSVDKIQEILPYISILMVNEVEFNQLCSSLGVDKFTIPVPALVVTKGEKGAEWICPADRKTIHVSAFKIDAVDTTAAGDTFAGYFTSGLEQDMSVESALEFASAAAAIKVTRHGTADAIPSKPTVVKFLKT